jgi:hypothetical protein
VLCWGALMGAGSELFPVIATVLESGGGEGIA